MQNFMNVYFLNVKINRDLNDTKFKEMNIFIIIKSNHRINIRQRVNMLNLLYKI